MMNLKTFSQTCQDLYAPGLNPDNCVERCFVFLKKLVPTELIVWALLDSRTTQLQTFVDRPHPDWHRAMQAFGSLMGRYSLFNFDPSMNEGRPFSRSQFYSKRQFRDIAIYQEVFRPIGIDNHCAVHVRAPDPSHVLFFGLERSGGPDFSQEERMLLELAQPHLANACALARIHAHPDMQSVDPESLHAAGLTPREAEILFWVSEGKSNPEIAALLRISIYTVKDHMTAVFNKTGVGNRLAASVWAREQCSRLRPARRLNNGGAIVPAHLPPSLKPLQSGISRLLNQ